MNLSVVFVSLILTEYYSPFLFSNYVILTCIQLLPKPACEVRYVYVFVIE